jgi:urease subunit gamma
MILVKAEVKGEPDVSPFTWIFEYQGKSDEQIFYESIGLIKEKLTRRLKINTNESLMLYCSYMIDQIRNGRSIDSIERNATRLLSPDMVMIGVPETLRTITFEVLLDNHPKRHITFKVPIATSNYVLASEDEIQRFHVSSGVSKIRD